MQGNANEPHPTRPRRHGGTTVQLRNRRDVRARHRRNLTHDTHAYDVSPSKPKPLNVNSPRSFAARRRRGGASLRQRLPLRRVSVRFGRDGHRARPRPAAWHQRFGSSRLERRRVHSICGACEVRGYESLQRPPTSTLADYRQVSRTRVRGQPKASARAVGIEHRTPFESARQCGKAVPPHVRLQPRRPRRPAIRLLRKARLHAGHPRHERHHRPRRPLLGIGSRARRHVPPLPLILPRPASAALHGLRRRWHL